MRRRGKDRKHTNALAAALLGAAFAVLAPAPPVVAQEAPEGAVALSFGDATALAEQAWAAGNVPAANEVARQVTQADPENVAALLILSASETALGRPTAGRRIAREALRFADTRTQRFEAAYLAAAGAMAEDRFTAAQFWLRRAYEVAETDVQRDRIANAFGAVRATSPWTFRLSFDAAPSSNVNGGATSEFLVIDDSPFVGVLSGAARALSGFEASVTGSLGYDVVRTQSTRTSVFVHAYRTFVTLSDEAKEIAPRAEGSDFEYGVAEVELVHRLFAPRGPLPDTYRLAFGQTWYGGERLDQVTRGAIGRAVRLSPRTRLRLAAEGEARESDRGEADRYGTKLRADLFHTLPGQLILRFGVEATEVSSTDENAEYSGRGAVLGLAMAEPAMGLRLAGRVRYTERDYQSYSIGFIDVPGGRQDSEWDASVDLFVHGADVYGFVPVLSVDGNWSTSNISRFEGESVGVSIGFVSAF